MASMAKTANNIVGVIRSRIRLRINVTIGVEEVSMNTMSISRRKFAQLLGAGAAVAIVKPAFSLATEPVARSTSTSVVRLSSNENPYGPSPKALKGMTDSFGLSCRYPDVHNDELIDALAKLNGVNRDQILLGDGSGEILKICAETFTGPTRGKLVAADPTFEAILHHASVNGAEIVKVPLTSSFSHDLPKMAAPRRRRAHLHLQPEQSHGQHHAEE